jgi:tRNA pseudouridine38-40 synthase
MVAMKRRRYSLHLSYVGTNYRGWQRQPDVMTVQEVVEEALGSIFKKEMIIYGCGRTDAGVHASQYFAHFEIDQKWSFDLLFILNKVLPNDISIHDIIPCEGTGDHARHDATARSYQYFFHTKKIAHLSECSSLYLNMKRNAVNGTGTSTQLDYKSMNEAVRLIPGYTDFISFCNSPSAHPSTDCDIKSVSFSRNQDATQFCFEITANRFLRGMIRNIVAWILLVGSGDRTIGDFERALKHELGGGQNQSQKPKAASPQGLYLSQVVYSFMDVKPDFDPKSVMLVAHGDTWIEE